MKSNYLNIPILANFYVLDKLAFKVGVQPGIFLSAKIKDNSSGNDETVSVSDLYKGMDFSVPDRRKLRIFQPADRRSALHDRRGQSARLGKIQRSIRYRPQVAEQLFHDFGRLRF